MSQTQTQKMIAFVAIRRERGGSATFAYLPNTDIQLPQRWEWAKIDGKIMTEDVTFIGCGMSLEATCRMMCTGTGVTF